MCVRVCMCVLCGLGDSVCVIFLGNMSDYKKLNVLSYKLMVKLL